jgi:hypothetical protein
MSVLLPNKPTKVTIDIGNPISSNTIVGDSGISILDNNTPNTNITLKTNNKTALYINDTQRIGINIPADPTKRLTINDELGESIRLIYNNNAYSDIKINQTGSLSFNTYNNQYINLNSDTNSPILKINNVLVESTAAELNYNHIQYTGIAEPKKALILDSGKSISGINNLSANNIIINNSLNIDTTSDEYLITLKNTTGKCIKLLNTNNGYNTFRMTDAGVLNIYNSNNIIEILSDKNNNLIYPIQITTENNLNNTGIGIKFNTYNNNNIKRNMSTIETIITNNQNNSENSIIKFNNMNNGNLNTTVTIRNDGFILCNTLMELSDARSKYIIGTSNFNESLKKICNINTYNFRYINDSNKVIHKGVIAQELYDIIPSAVNIEKTDNLDDLHTISNKELIGYLIDSIKALNNKIDKLQNKT